MKAYYMNGDTSGVTDIPSYILVKRFEDMNAETEFTLHVRFGHHVDEVMYDNKTYYIISPHELKKEVTCLTS